MSGATFDHEPSPDHSEPTAARLDPEFRGFIELVAQVFEIDGYDLEVTTEHGTTEARIITQAPTETPIEHPQAS